MPPDPVASGTPDDTSALSSAGKTLPQGPFVGRETFRQHLRLAFAQAAAQGWREWILCDPDFADWPLGEAAVTHALQAWSQGSGQRLVMLAGSYNSVARLHPRFMHWRRQWAHKIDCRLCSRTDARELPGMLWSPDWTLLRPEAMPGHGITGSEPQRLSQTREQLNAWLQRARPGFPVVTLGL